MTEALHETIRTLRASGASFGVIVDRLGCSRSTVAGLVWRHGLGRPKGITKQTVIRRRRGSKYTAEQKAAAVQTLLVFGHIIAAKQHGVSWRTIYRWAHDARALK